LSVDERTLRRGVLSLAHFTGWSRAEILDLPIDELFACVSEIPRE